MAEDRIQRILSALNDEIENYTRQAREAENSGTYNWASGMVRGLERAKTIVEQTD